MARPSGNLVTATELLIAHTTALLLQGSSGARVKISSNFTTRQAYLLQHSYSKAPVELEQTFDRIMHQDSLLLQHSYSNAPVVLGPKFDQILQLDKPTYYSTATLKIQQS